jgi:hypothetical protein
MLNAGATLLRDKTIFELCTSFLRLFVHNCIL